MFYLDPLYLIVALPGLLFGLWATMQTKRTFSQFSRRAASSGITGAEAARRILRSEGLDDVAVERSEGFLSDHFDPRRNVLRLSPSVYGSNSLAALGVACHEAGHALQKAHGYAPLAMRTALVPVTQFGSNLAIPIFFIGMIMQMPIMVKAGIVLFIAVVAFSIITLPVEWDASARAKQYMVNAGIVTPQEQDQAAKVLNAAFMTYVAQTVSAVLTLLYLLMRARR